MSEVSKDGKISGRVAATRNGLSLAVDSAGAVYLRDSSGARITGVVSLVVKQDMNDATRVEAIFYVSSPPSECKT